MNVGIIRFLLWRAALSSPGPTFADWSPRPHDGAERAALEEKGREGSGRREAKEVGIRDLYSHAWLLPILGSSPVASLPIGSRTRHTRRVLGSRGSFPVHLNSFELSTSSREAARAEHLRVGTR